jgi:predicted esterase
VVPESGRIFFQIAFAPIDPFQTIRINPKNNDRPPLLLIAGERDHMVPAHIARANYNHYKHSKAHTDFKEFEGRAHLIIAEEGWEEVAGYIAGWIGWIEELTGLSRAQPLIQAVY